MWRTLVQLPRTVWLLAFVSFFNDTASELVYPLVPIYLASVLMAGPRALGIVEGIAEATGSLLKLFAGVMADRSRTTKPWVVGGYALAAISRPLFAFVTSWPMVIALRFGDRVGKGLRSSPRDALLARAIAPEQRGLAFGFHRAMDNLGAVIGPLLAAALLAAEVPLLWALVALTASVFATPLSALSDRWGRGRLIITGWIVYAGFYLLLGLNGVEAMVWPLFAVYGLFMALTEGAEKAFVADLAPREALGTAFGWFNLTSGLLLLPASLLFGQLWEHAGAQTAFCFSAACAGGAAVLMKWWVKGDAPRVV